MALITVAQGTANVPYFAESISTQSDNHHPKTSPKHGLAKGPQTILGHWCTSNIGAKNPEKIWMGLDDTEESPTEELEGYP